MTAKETCEFMGFTCAQRLHNQRLIQRGEFESLSNDEITVICNAFKHKLRELNNDL
jgi:hypothetical protein